MKSNIIKPLFTLALAAVIGLCASCAQTQEKHPVDAALLAKAKIKQAQAEKIALAKAPDGTVAKSHLKDKKGKLVWSIGLSRPKTANITKVHIDATTGKVLDVKVEKPEDEAKEKKEKNEKEEKEDAPKAR